MSLLPARPRFDARPGDWLFISCASWQNPSYCKQLRWLVDQFALKVAVLIHDVIPITHPQYCTPHARGQFLPWFRDVVSLSDLIVTSSEYNANTLRALQNDLHLPPIRLVQFGIDPLPGDLESAARSSLNLPREFALVVGTLEIRKNHIALVRVWQKLLELYKQDRVPSLVFAGRMGWMVEPLKRELRKTNFLDGKVVITSDLTDINLRQAYQRSSFTLLPSLVEGWGLPVAESLISGKLCISSNRGALPEVGQDFVDYFDPEDDLSIQRAVERVIVDPIYRAGRNFYISKCYKGPTWSACARQLIDTIDEFGAHEPSARTGVH